MLAASNIDLSLRDDSGIGEVEARFVHEETGDGRRGEYFRRGHYILLRGDGEDQTDATVTISGQITDENLIGEYRCMHIEATDVRGNLKYHDSEGAELTGWRFAE